MKKTLLFLAVSLFLMTSCTENKEDLVSRIIKETKTHSSVHFKVTEKYCYSNAPDTTVTPLEVWALRDKNDSLRNGYVWVNNYYRPYNMIYDAGNFYLAIPPKKTTVLYKNFKEDFISPVDWIDIFLKPERLKALVAQPKTKTTISDTTYQGKNCAKIEFQFQNGAKKYIFVVDKKRLVPLWSKMIVKKKDYVYSDELFFSDYTFDKVDLGKLKEAQKKILAENPVEDEGSNSEVVRMEKMLHVGDKAPLFAGKFYSSGKEFHLADYVGKEVIIVDFWYTHCPPCVRAMPALSKLYTEYKNKGLIVFGLNSVDNQPRSLGYLKTFLQKRKISYSVVLTQPEVDLRYKINGYPTMYIVNKEGKIAYVEVGFDQEKLSRLKEKVKELTQ
jgi:thiol-disulfide isomerase/thioredoxin/outer membrane lipoprotein-sorting protein